jgi:serine/threonine protein phosphatase PrpC
MRNFVECCLGGNSTLPGMTVTGAKRLQTGDVLLACSDGFWSGLGDEDIALVGKGDEPLVQTLRRAAERAVRTAGPHSDNTSVVAVRVTG